MVGIYQGVGFVTGRGQGCIFPGDWKGWLGLVVLDLAAVQEVVLETGLLKGGWVRLLTAQDERLMEACLLEGGWSGLQ